MKKNSLLMIAAAILMTACGTMAQHSASSGSSRFEDGIYSSGPSFLSRAEKQEYRAEADSLIEKTKASTIYLFGEKKDTVMIPDDMSASIWYDKEKGSTVVNVGYNPYDWQNNIDPWSYYTPYSIGSSWYWSRHYDPWYSSSYYWNTWAYTPYRYHGWYDPFYMGGWYGGWYDPYYGYMHPHYCGWYGGWDPYWGYYPHHHHPIYIKDDSWHGSRHSTGSDRVFTSRVSTRGGVASSSRVGRTTSASSVSRAQTSGNATVSRTPSRTSASRVSASTPSRVSASKGSITARPGASSGASNAVSRQNYRRPSSTASGYTPSTSSSSSTYRSSDTQSYRSSGTSYRSSSPSSSSSTSRSSYSTSSSSRSSYSGGGSRSGGSSSGRR